MQYFKFIKKFLGKHKVLTAMSILFFLCTAITNKYGPYVGKVVDAETGEPIEGAVIYREFSTNYPSLGGAIGQYAGAAETLTDVNGAFELSYRAFVFRPFSVWNSYPRLVIFKPGYGVYPKHDRAYLVPNETGGWDLPEGKRVTVNLPKLITKEEREANLSSIFFRSDLVPYEKRKNVTDIRNKERAYLGYGPVGVK